MDQALEALLGNYYNEQRYCVIKADIEKKIEVISVFPDSVERMPWSGHLGIQLLDKVIEIVKGQYDHVDLYEYKILCGDMVSQNAGQSP